MSSTAAVRRDAELVARAVEREVREGYARRARRVRLLRSAYVVAWFAGLAPLFWGLFHRDVETWHIVVYAVVGVAGVWFVPSVPRRPDPFDDYHDLHVVRAASLVTVGPDDATLVLDLARDLDGVAVARLTAHGVVELVLRQNFGVSVAFSGLRCLNRGDGGRERRRFWIGDSNGEVFAFACRSFEVLELEERRRGEVRAAAQGA